MGRDLIGIAQTGTGKTAAFVLPMIDILGEGRSRARMPRSLILEPTRELAMQVSENFEKYGKYHKLNMALLIGGTNMADQIKKLEKGVDVLIATPGRLMDLFGRGKIMLNGCSLLVIDEADRMLDMGFIPDIEEICSKLPAVRQTLLFSATMPGPIKKLADKFLTGPKTIEVARPATANLRSTSASSRSIRARRATLTDRLRGHDVRSALVFCNRKTTVRELAQSLKRRPQRRRDPRRHGAARADPRTGPFQGRRDQHPRRLRRRRPRPRHQGRQPRLQLRRALASRRLYPPHRPHRPGRQDRDRHHPRHARGRRGDRAIEKLTGARIAVGGGAPAAEGESRGRRTSGKRAEPRGGLPSAIQSGGKSRRAQAGTGRSNRHRAGARSRYRTAGTGPSFLGQKLGD